MTQDTGVKRGFMRFGIAFFALLAINTGLQYGSQFIIEAINPAILDHPSTIWIMSTVPLYVFALPVCLAILGKRETGSEYEKSRLTLPLFLLATVICFGASSIGNLVGNFLIQLFSAITKTQFTNPLMEILPDSNPVYLFVTTVIIAPMGEEFIFRRLAIDSTRRYGERFAVILSAAMFAAFHTNIFQIPYAFLVGLVLGYVYIKTNRLIYPVLLHAIMNFFGGVFSTQMLDRMNAILESGADMTETDAAVLLALSLITLVYVTFLFGCGITTCILAIVKRSSVKLGKGGEEVNILKSPFIMLFFAACLVLTILRIILG